MHELGVLLEVVKQVEKIAIENEVERIETLVLQVGELCSMVPKYLTKLYPAAVEGTLLHGSELQIEIIPGNGRCRQCGQIFNLIDNKGVCPECKTKEFEMLSGKEFFIKEIVTYE
ncbi:hydrogenase maturation nickel metallochaperone HypA/HybF [Anaerosporobacter sp.]|uniref:hydrogenase maturation nickel metallochaperone HypA/HybF n=1 Tax=Anaerosporobacter sp. TaxID=1872529 RepID=UPI00286F0221|nr:hydrogenase maturation nickel metallochaperone HypA [Anaerosporobacter sp.]